MPNRPDPVRSGPIDVLPHSTGSTLFGNQSVPRGSDNTHVAGYALMRELGMTTIREGWNWKNVEVNKHQYVSWMDYFDQKASEFEKMGIRVQAMVTDTPDWASSDPTYASKSGWDAASLGKYTVPKGLYSSMFADGTDVYKPGVRANPENYYADYLFDMVERYKGKIHYWQVWNEPDYPSGDLESGTTASSGVHRYWAGSVQDYVRLLKISSTIVRGMDPAAKVTLGGLGYESYLAAILEQGGSSYFDVVDFHAYGSDKSSSNGVLDSDWGFNGRYQAMKRVLSEKGVMDKTFGCSETGLSADKGDDQGSYVLKLFASAMAQGDIEYVQWAVFTNPGHDNIGILDQATLSQKTPGYRAYQFATRQFAGATFDATLEVPDAKAFRYQRSDGKEMIVAWATGAKASLKVGAKAMEILNVFGNRKASAAPGSSIPLGTDPVYLISP